MQRELPPAEEYYRPRRAGELRQKAVWLERWGCLQLAGSGFAVILFVLVGLVWASGFSGLVAELALVLLGAGAVGLLAAGPYLLERARRCRLEAARLEAEHGTRRDPPQKR